MIGRDKNRTSWRVLKLDRTEPTEVNIYEDSTAYTEAECFETLRRIHEGNKSSGGLKFVTTCYGIIGNQCLYSIKHLILYCFFFFLSLTCLTSIASWCRIHKVLGTLLHADNH